MNAYDTGYKLKFNKRDWSTNAMIKRFFIIKNKTQINETRRSFKDIWIKGVQVSL